MLDDYSEVQLIAYNILMNEIKNNKTSHAYLIDENNYSESFDFVMAFVKEILTKDLDDNEKSVLCRRIDDGNFPEVKVIEPDGMLIKKQQILDLQMDFSRSVVEGNKRIYIIKEADKMRNETSNSMLKFLEEPDNDIIAILMTNNFNNMLPTIISRCQVIRLVDNGKDTSDRKFNDLIMNFIESVENNGIKTIMNEQELLFNTISVKERNRFVDVFDKIIDMYYDIMKISSGEEDIIYMEYLNRFKAIASKNKTDDLLEKIIYLISVKDKIKNNVNINLLIDSVIVKIGG